MTAATEPDPPEAGTARHPAAARRLRVLSIAPTSFFGDYGCHVRILEEARALKALGHDVAILTYFKGSDVPGFRIIRTLPTPWHADYEVGSSRHKFAFDALLGLRLARVLARNRFDLVHAHLHEGALIGSVVARPWRIPVCFDYQGSLTDEMTQHGFMRRDSRLAAGFWRRIERLANRLPAAIFTSTRRAADALRAEFPSKPIWPLPDGVNTDEFRPDALAPDERYRMRASLGISPDDLAVVFLGLLARHQGIGSIIEAAALLKAAGRRVRWLVMGYPSVSAWQAEAAAAGVGGEVVFTGRVPYPAAPRMLALGDIAVAPKLSLSEGSGKILNYMAAGLPTVAFETPAQVEYLGNLGVYAALGDARGLADQVAGLADQPARRSELGALLRARAEQHFSWRRTGSQLEALYGQVLRGDAAQPRAVSSGTHPQHGL
jgi:glycosyltransferase involved in cell wall biosynthesis